MFKSMSSITSNSSSGGGGGGGVSSSTTASTSLSALPLSGESSASDAEIGQGAIRLADQLKAFVPQNALPEVTSPNSPQIPDLQLAICRKLRELLPSNKDLLNMAQSQNWIPILLSWLNLHDRPAVQVEALLALTNVAELCCAVSTSAASHHLTAAHAHAHAAHAAAAAHHPLTHHHHHNHPHNHHPLTHHPLHQAAAAAAATATAGASVSVPFNNNTNSNNTSISTSSSSATGITSTPGVVNNTATSVAAAASSVAAAAAAAQAAVSAVKGAAGVSGVSSSGVGVGVGGGIVGPWNEAVEAAAVASKYASSSAAVAAAAAASSSLSSSSTAAKYNPYLGAAAAAAAAGASAAAAAAAVAAPPGSVPFPPLSFSQTLSPEAVAAFDASLTQTILACSGGTAATTTTTGLDISKSGGMGTITPAAAAAAALSHTSTWTMPPAPLFPTSAPTATGGINFTSLAPPPGGAHTSVPSNAFLPPPTPVTAPNFPQQLSASSQHMLLRHADAIPTLISLLSSPRREVYEQAAWILGSIAAGDSPSSSSSPSSGSNLSASNNTSGAGVGVTADHRDGSSSLGGGSGGTSSSGSSSSNSNSSSGNGKSVSARDVILAAGVMNQLIRCMEMHPTNLSLQRIGSWTLSNLVDGIFQQPNSNNSNNSSSNNSSSNNNQSSSGSSQTGAGGGAGSSLSQQGTGSNLRSNSSSGTSNKSSSGGDSSSNHHHHSHHAYSSADEIDMNVLLPVLRRLLRMSDAEVLGYTCWALSHLCDGPSSHIAAVVTSPSYPATTTTATITTTTATTTDSDQPENDLSTNTHQNCGLVPRLVELLTHPSWRVTKPALRTIGNIVCAECGDEDQTDYTEIILECQAVPRLKQLVEHSNREIQKEACWTLSNIAAGTVDQIQAVIDSGAIPPLVKLVKDKKTDQEVRSEACWVVLNATSCGSDSQIEVLVDEGCVSVLGVLLSEASMVMMALEGLERVLQVEESRGMRPAPLVTAELIEKARESHNSSAVIKRADRIWKTHFVQCALCKLSFSKHRGEASFCEECKCHVCGNCNCKIYHLDYQEELWAATEEKVEAKKIAKKSKNKKKKAKKKAAKLQQEVSEGGTVGGPDDTNGTDDPLVIQAVDPIHEQPMQTSGNEDDDNPNAKNVNVNNKPPSPSFDDEEDDSNVVDFVLYLQQTGSIIALAKLMDALEYGDEEELNDYERRMIREQKQMMMRGGAGSDQPHATIPSSAH